MKELKVHTYEEAVRLIHEVGILPLAPLIPDHPSLYQITHGESWLTGTDLDPWLWRARFPSDGTAAYGKFLKKKSVLISRELFPWVKAILGNPQPVEDRYKHGLVSKASLELFQQIREEEGIETRSLRLKTGMNAKEMKKTFGQGLLELQCMLDIVISGVKENRVLVDEKSAWQSTSFQTADHWMESVGLHEINIDLKIAKKELHSRLKSSCSPDAMKFFTKLFQFD
ncbi:hypothetical protein Back11_60170 [Paenibacillus baekrokdamisoli]|uniref:Uncharacterized protein n=1 Tax=Paenibacillus baekrokdamisoli TaxID=1712516 RepID=A0A3G9J292_9BACL|nr:hypothetical protein [Paenibacillus baekrokdamisoli]MBB3071292.1 hypothetical protein [Paenibacillus baekrokdamisoli]BBH24672.1 hypothetical protein Back11_60170 [Paenibacillus baekrokdamisoli]